MACSCCAIELALCRSRRIARAVPSAHRFPLQSAHQRRRSFCTWSTSQSQVYASVKPADAAHHHGQIADDHVIDSISRRYRSSVPAQEQEELDALLKVGERSNVIVQGAIRSCDSNQVGANTPCEDQYSQAKCVGSNAWLFGVFDGHGGGACSKRIVNSLYDYICAAVLRKHQEAHVRDSEVQWLYTSSAATPNEIYRQSHKNNVRKFLERFRQSADFHQGTVRQALQTAFVSLDDDIAKEALPDVRGHVSHYNASIVQSGSCATVAHIRGPHLHVANTGDSVAVLGVQNEHGAWTARQLTREHCVENQDEVDRIRAAHPAKEHDSVLKGGRLLGQLFPLRSFGDVRYKWTEELQRVVLEPLFPHGMGVPPALLTPPYLTAQPEVFYHRLTPNDKFLILATDGLWELLSPDRVVRLLADHAIGVQTLGNFVPSPEANLSQIRSELLLRKAGESKRPKDENSATHLIRYALGGTSASMQYQNLKEMLKLPPAVARNFRDDITITVIYFNSNYLETADVPR